MWDYYNPKNPDVQQKTLQNVRLMRLNNIVKNIRAPFVKNYTDYLTYLK